ncbi:pentatricopeptide repeat-containing protein At3g04750, mitochondrial [Fagus crenata]
MYIRSKTDSLSCCRHGVVVLWLSAKRGYSLEALELFSEMVGLGLEPDEFTIVGLLVSCEQLGNARLGKSVHAWIEQRKSISSSNLILGNALLDLYVKCKKLESAQRIFDALVEKDIISWNTMIAGYAKGDYMMVMSLFNSMVLNNVRPDSVTMAILVHAAAEIGGLEQGKLIHSLVVRMQMKVDAFLGSALIDMYCNVVIDGVFHDFVAAEKLHLRWEEIQSILNCLKNEMKSSADFSFNFFLQMSLDLC